MKILMICPHPLKKTLGASKVYLENAETYKSLGHDVDVISADQFLDIPEIHPDFLEKFSDVVKKHLGEVGNEYDIIECEYLYLPFGREAYPKKPLLVARSILLELHLLDLEFPSFKTLRSFVGKIVNGGKRRATLERRVSYAMKTFESCDYINLANPWDKEVLIEKGIASSKIVVAPYGLFEERLNALNVEKKLSEENFRIGFVGTFDPRKGAVEFPEILEKLYNHNPNIRLKLLGTSSMFPDAASVKNKFPQRLRDNIEVIESFKVDELPHLLKDCHCGIFPSYLESFGFGLLEMLATGMPVAAYETPGPKMILDGNWISKRGNFQGLVNTIIKWIDSEEVLKSDQKTARSLAEGYSWLESCQKTLDQYEQVLGSRT